MVSTTLMISGRKSIMLTLQNGPQLGDWFQSSFSFKKKLKYQAVFTHLKTGIAWLNTSDRHSSNLLQENSLWRISHSIFTNTVLDQRQPPCLETGQFPRVETWFRQKIWLTPAFWCQLSKFAMISYQMQSPRRSNIDLKTSNAWRNTKMDFISLRPFGPP